MDDNTAGTNKLNKISRKAEDAGRSYRGFNFFDDEDQKLFQSLARGRVQLSAASKVKIFAGNCRIKPTARSHDC